MGEMESLEGKDSLMQDAGQEGIRRDAGKVREKRRETNSLSPLGLTCRFLCSPVRS